MPNSMPAKKEAKTEAMMASEPKPEVKEAYCSVMFTGETIVIFYWVSSVVFEDFATGSHTHVLDVLFVLFKVVLVVYGLRGKAFELFVKLLTDALNEAVWLQ